MGRPPLPVGSYGDIDYLTHQGRVRARARYRDMDGRTRPVTRWGQSKAAAKRRLLEALGDRSGPSGATGHTTVADAAALWLAEVDRSGKAANTRTLYRRTVEGKIIPALGSLRLREVDVPAVDRFLTGLLHDAGGASMAKTTRTVLSGIFGMAVRHGAIPANPTKGVTPIHVSKHPARALTTGEAALLVSRIASDRRALDLADLVRFQLATGARIGEAIALSWGRLDLAAGTVDIRATMIRETGKGLSVQPKPKSGAGVRTLALPPSTVAMLNVRRERVYRDSVMVFPTVYGNLRDPSNTIKDLRQACDRAGFGWVTSHTFRKTVATRLDEAGLSARQIADQLGHAHPSLTLDTYVGRKVVSAAAAGILGDHNTTCLLQDAAGRGRPQVAL